MARSKKVYHIRGALLYVSLFVHLVWAVIFSYVIISGPFSGINSKFDTLFKFVGCETCLRATDSVKSAYEMGRLELVSLSLTILAVVIGLGAFVGFFLVRGAAMSAAADEAERRVTAALPELLKEKDIIKAMIEDEQGLFTLANLIDRKLRESHGDADAEDDAANRIAESFDDED